jgi:hypothetical protein
MAPHGTIASNGNPRFRCRNRDCSSYGKTSVQRLLPTPADVRRSCEIVFPGVEWRCEASNSNQIYFCAKTEHFYIELDVLNIGAICFFNEKKRGEMFRSKNVKGQSIDEALEGIKEKIQGLSKELDSILGFSENG